MGSLVDCPNEQLCTHFIWLYTFTPWIISPLLDGHSSLDLLILETYSHTQPGWEEHNFLVVRIEFRTTVHSNDSTYKG